MIAWSRRTVELGLIMLALLVTAGAYTLGALGVTSSIPADIGPFLLIVAGLLIAAHVATRYLARGADPILLPVAVLLNGIGYVFIARVNSDLAARQATWTFIGVVAYIATLLALRRVKELERYKWTFALAGVLLLLMPLVPGLGRTINGSRIWIIIGPLSFQPGEFAKIALALFFAAYLTERRELLAMATWRVGPLWLPEPRHLAPIVGAWATSVVIMVFEKDLGSSLLFFLLFVVMVWVATERVSYLVVGTGLFAIGAVGMWSTLTHVQDRVSIWLNPWDDPQGKGYQVIQAVFAMAWGGLTGTGIGLGDPTRIPEVQNDFIFAAIGEELGLFGTVGILIAFLLFIGAGLRVATRAERPFEKLLATGLTAILGLQAFVIIGGVIRLVPLTGVTLPFVSYGGSSLVANYVLLAILMRISDTTAQRNHEVLPTRREERRHERAVLAAVNAPAPVYGTGDGYEADS